MPATQHALQRSAAPDPALQYPAALLAKGWGGTWTLPCPKPPCSPLLLAIPGWR